MMITYTIIIPHKNIPQLLQRCLDSISQREDVQVIVVDDNSDPEKVDFVHFPGSDRKDVECYFTKEGEGAGYARNVGLKHAHGRWLLFADADDFFHPNLFEVIDPWKDSACDIIYFDTDSVDSDTLEPVVPRLHLNSLNKTKNDICKEHHGWFVPWGKMIRTKMVRMYGISFEEIRWANDVMFSARCSFHAGENVDVCEDLLYCATERRDSLSTEQATEEHIMCRMNTTLRYERFACKHHLCMSSAKTPVSFLYLGMMRQFGKKKYRQAKIYYFKHACYPTLAKVVIQIIRFQIRRKLMHAK